MIFYKLLLHNNNVDVNQKIHYIQYEGYFINLIKFNSKIFNFVCIYINSTIFLKLYKIYNRQKFNYSLF
jgi:hypothetical protein